LESDLASSETVMGSSEKDQTTMRLLAREVVPQSTSAASPNGVAAPVTELGFAETPSYSTDKEVALLLAEFEQIGLKYVELANLAVAKGDLRKANHYARKATELAPEHPLVQAMAVPVEAVRPTSEEKTRPVVIPTGTKASQQTSIDIQELAEDGETSIALSPFAAQKSSTESSDELVTRSGDELLATFGPAPIQEESLSQDLDSDILEMLSLVVPVYPGELFVPFNEPDRSHDRDVASGSAGNSGGGGSGGGGSGGGGSGGGGSGGGGSGGGNGNGGGNGGGNGNGSGNGGGNGNGSGRN
jgi:hypothetical protein